MGSGLFSAITKVKVPTNTANQGQKTSKEDNYILPGTHIFEINRVLKHKKAGINGQEFFICEMKVIESSNPDMKVGSMKSFLEAFKYDGMMSNKTKQLEYPGLARVKQLILAAVASDGLGPDDITEEMLENEVIGENCLAGRRIKDVANQPKGEGTFLYNNFMPVE